MIDRTLSLLFHRLCRWLDPLLALTALGLVWLAGNYRTMPTHFTEFLALRITLKNLILLMIFLVAWNLICRACGLYERAEIHRFRTETHRILWACTLCMAPCAMFALTSVSGSFRPVFVVACWAALITLMVSVRVVLRLLSGVHGRRPGSMRRALIVGSSQRAQFVHHRLCHSLETPYEVIGFVDNPGSHDVPEIVQEKLIGTLPEMRELLKNNVVDEVFLTLPMKSHYAQIQEIIYACEETGVEVRLPSDAFTFSIAHVCVEQRDATPGITLKTVRENFARRVVKRCIDVVGAVVGLFMFAPLMLLIGAAIKFTSPGPVFFAQPRYGRNRRLFRMYKFRTMVSNAESLQASLEARNDLRGPAFKMKQDPRITPLGGFLRRTSLDELPQFWNVLTGEMSLVGPRPLPTRDVSRFSEAWLMRRFSVKPGLTCLWQIHGRSNVDFDRWIELDLHYIDRWSLGLDFRILAKTVSVVLRGQGAA